LEIEAANLIEQGGSTSMALQQLQSTGISGAAKACIAMRLESLAGAQ
jgi:hypothetical protein